MTHRPSLPRLLSVGVAAVLLVAACGDDDTAGTAGTAGSLEGLFGIAAGECDDGGVTSGSSFRMIQPGGSVEDGPFVENGDSTCADTTWTALVPGADGGLRTGSHQPLPEPAFDDEGNAVATAITEPIVFFAVDFSVATNPVDPQTGTAVDPPSVRVDDAGDLSGDLRAFAASWNQQHFNQGAPKPDGSNPGLTSPPSGTYDPDTGAYTLEWTSQIVGGPFNNFTGLWHLEGTFEPAS